ATGREVFKVVVPTNVWTLEFTPDGGSVVCDGPVLYRYELPAGRLIGNWRRPEGADLAWLACGNDGIYLLKTDDGHLTVHDVIAGKPATFPLRLPVCIAGRHAPGELFVSYRRTRLVVWDLRTGRPRHLPAGHACTITGV